MGANVAKPSDNASRPTNKSDSTPDELLSDGDISSVPDSNERKQLKTNIHEKHTKQKNFRSKPLESSSNTQPDSDICEDERVKYDDNKAILRMPQNNENLPPIRDSPQTTSTFTNSLTDKKRLSKVAGLSSANTSAGDMSYTFADDSRKQKSANKVSNLDKIRSNDSSNSASTDNDLLNELTLNTDFVTESYPETYADRGRKQLYKRQESDLLREKTIYRDPTEWSYSHENKQSLLERGTNHLQEELHLTPNTNDPVKRVADKEKTPRDVSYTLPEYSKMEEKLMMDIEKDYV